MSVPTLPGLPSGITSRIVAVQDLDIHILEAAPPSTDSSSKPPLLLLLHGFPELAYSWRKIMTPLAAEGYLVVAPDQRGYGQTKSRKPGERQGKISYDDDIAPFRMINLATDIVGLVYALGYTSVAAIIGHDFGSPVAAHCALIRPDLFRSMVLMSAPYSGPPELSEFEKPDAKSLAHRVNEMLAKLDPPFKHYTMYFSGPDADRDMLNPPGGLHAFLRGYYHLKSADWEKNGSCAPVDLSKGVVGALAVLPQYYIMPFSKTMPECIVDNAASEEIASSTWLTDEELDYYINQFQERGFQGGLNWYRCQTDSLKWSEDLRIFSGKEIEVPAMFIGGVRDWGVWQIPGAAEKMRQRLRRQMNEDDFVLVDGAGHWVQQEKPEAVVRNLLRFLRKTSS